MRTPEPGILNAISVDVEEHFQVSAFESSVDRRDWDSHESRVEANTERLLELFEGAGVRGTFFTLGWIAERHPALLRRIVDGGHELACHGWAHRLVYEQSPDAFRAEVRRSKAALEDAAGRRVVGYRAASFSIRRDSFWALDVLAAEGFEYDSSLFPVYHDRYGVPGMPRRIYRLRTPSGAELVEVPPSTVRFAGTTLAVAGGGYLRIFPAAVTHWAIRRLNRREGMPAIVYLHPWEVDPDQPRIDAPWKSRLRHYSRLRSMLPKLAELLRRYRFGTMIDTIRAHGADARTVDLGDPRPAPAAGAVQAGRGG